MTELRSISSTFRSGTFFDKPLTCLVSLCLSARLSCSVQHGRTEHPVVAACLAIMRRVQPAKDQVRQEDPVQAMCAPESRPRMPAAHHPRPGHAYSVRPGHVPSFNTPSTCSPSEHQLIKSGRAPSTVSLQTPRTIPSMNCSKSDALSRRRSPNSRLH